MSAKWAGGCSQFRDRAAEQGLAPEGHTQRADLARFYLMLRTAVEVGDRARVTGQLPGDPRHLLFGHVLIVAVEGLTGDRPGVTQQEQLDGAGDIGGVNLLAALGAGARLAPHTLAREREPAGL